MSQSKAQLRTELYISRQRQHALEQLVAALIRQENYQEALGHIQSSVLVNRDVGLPNPERSSSSYTSHMIGSDTDSSAKRAQGEADGPVTANLGVEAPTSDADRHPGVQEATGSKGQQDVISELLSQLSRSSGYGASVSLIDIYRSPKGVD